MIALTPFASWLLFGACILVGLVVYVIVAGGRRYRRILSDADTLGQLGRALEAMRYDPTLFIRVSGGIYDWQARGDFDR